MFLCVYNDVDHLKKNKFSILAIESSETQIVLHILLIILAYKKGNLGHLCGEPDIHKLRCVLGLYIILLFLVTFGAWVCFGLKI